ncbi:MAG: hypothetical protein QXJ59_10645 [Thermofilaceae archaeon]
MARYSSRYPPPKAKELASELGVSIKTVYKALYKYRKLYGRLPSSTEDPSTPVVSQNYPASSRTTRGFK